jgi:hypothetical protein
MNEKSKAFEKEHKTYEALKVMIQIAIALLIGGFGVGLFEILEAYNTLEEVGFFGTVLGLFGIFTSGTFLWSLVASIIQAAEDTHRQAIDKINKL